MGAFFACNPLNREVIASRTILRARAVFETAKGMTVAGEAGLTTKVVKFARTRSGSSVLAVSSRGWLVSIGNWHHPDIAERDDTSSLLEYLEAQGISALDDLDGGYVIAWYDEPTDTLTVVPDHLGRLHAYFVVSDSGVFVSSSAMALAAVVPCEPDPVAVYELLATGTIWEDRSPFTNIRRLQDTTRYFFRNGRLDSTDRITGLMVPRPGRMPGQSSLDDVIAAYHSSLTRSLGGYQRIVVDLTGGYDTRLLVGFLHRFGYQFDATVSGKPTHRDVSCAQKLSDSIGIKLVREPPEVVTPEKSSFPRVLSAAARVDGKHDAIEYVGIEHVQHTHAERYDAGVNGAGGEMWRSFWWDSRHLKPKSNSPIPRVLPRFAGLAIDPLFLDREWTLNPFDHFTGVLTRSLKGRIGYPPHDQLDHFYVGVRMQNWQGTITTATNEIWPNLTLHLDRRPLEMIFDIEPSERLSCRLVNEMFRRFGKPFANVPLERGLPPQNLTLLNAWRFALAARGKPAYFWDVWRQRQVRKVGVDKQSADIVRALFRSGAADYLQPHSMALMPLFDKNRLDSFLDVAERTGEVPLTLVGRLIALEFAFRSAA